MKYDYIIVGAGSAGCVLADRLSADGRSHVLLLEAGSANWSPYVEMPRGWAKLWKDPRYFWHFPIEPQDGRPANESWAYGKGLGGSSAVNGTMYFRGQPRDYDSWEAQGNEGWNWSEMARRFQVLESYMGETDDPTRGRDGPVHISTLEDHSEVIAAVIAAGEEMGLPRRIDINGKDRFGVGFTQTTVNRRGRRVSADSAFLRPARKRKNLTIITGAHVKRVVFAGNTATGVLCDVRGVEQSFGAVGEVILCAGVLQSPKMLQLSGVGPAELLVRHGIPVVQNLPHVGQNMVEHVMLSHSYRLKGAAGINREFRGWRLLGNTLRYLLRGTGVMSYATAEVSAFTSLSGDIGWPDLQLCISPFTLMAEDGGTLEPGRGKTERAPGINITGLYLRPSSRGSVAIRSARYDDAPRIDANWLSEESDQRAIVESVKAMRRLMRQPALRDYVAEETVPGDELQSDEAILASALWSLSSGLHGTGTCRMGNVREAVVDSRLRVHGVKGLRVVDCSAMPTSISGNTNGPAMAFALRAADFLLEDGEHLVKASGVD